MMRRNSPVVGKPAWYDPIRPTVEKPGWGRNAPVIVVSMRKDTLCYVTVKNSAGDEKEVAHFDLDCGYSFQTRRGEWQHESDPRVLKWLAKMAVTPSTHPDACVREKDVELRRHWQWIVDRNKQAV